MVRIISAALLLLAIISSVQGEDAPPKTLAVKKVLAVLEKAELTGQGCGGCNWNGEQWNLFVNFYKPIKLPWHTEPQRVTAAFAWGEMSTNTQLIEFYGPGFRYERSTDVPDLTLKPREKESK